MCRSDALIGLSSTRTSASPGAKGGVGTSASFNTLFGSPVSRKINAFINTSWVFRRRLIPAGCSLLPTNLPLLSRRLQLPIPIGVDLPLTPGEHVLRRDVANRAVQADVVVMLDVALHQTPRIFQRQRRSRPDALSLERFVPAFDLSVRLRIVGRGPDVCHARDPTVEISNVPSHPARHLRAQVTRSFRIIVG